MRKQGLDVEFTSVSRREKSHVGFVSKMNLSKMNTKISGLEKNYGLLDWIWSIKERNGYAFRILLKICCSTRQSNC